MVAKGSYQDPLGENTYLQDPYEAEETLSLSDLLICSDPSDQDGNSKDQDQSWPQGDDFFEFLSKDFAASTCAATANKNIIFCGKLIPYKELPSPEKTWTHGCTDTKDFTRRKTSFDGNHSVNFNKKKSSSIYSKLQSDKVSLMASPVKSPPCMFMFGMARFPTEMELRDIRTRQRRMSSESSMLCSTEFDGMVKAKAKAKAKANANANANANGERRGEKRLWRRLRRSLGLGAKQGGTKKSNFSIK